VQFFKVCGQTDKEFAWVFPGIVEIDNRMNAAPVCKGLPGSGPSHIRLIRG
jgi:hypothetical protein